MRKSGRPELPSAPARGGRRGLCSEVPSPADGVPAGEPARPCAGTAQLCHLHLGCFSYFCVTVSLAFAHPKNQFGTVLCSPKETCAGAGVLAPAPCGAASSESQAAGSGTTGISRATGHGARPGDGDEDPGRARGYNGQSDKIRNQHSGKSNQRATFLSPSPQRSPLQIGPLCPAALCPLMSQRCPNLPGCSWPVPGSFSGSQCLPPPTTRAFQNAPAHAAQVAGVALLGLGQQPWPLPPPQSLTKVPQMPSKPQGAVAFSKNGILICFSSMN